MIMLALSFSFWPFHHKPMTPKANQKLFAHIKAKCGEDFECAETVLDKRAAKYIRLR